MDGALVDVLDDVDALEGAVTRRQAARDLEVALEDGKEDGAGRHADDEPRPDLAPEDDAQADLAEPQPVGVGQQVDDENTRANTTAATAMAIVRPWWRGFDAAGFLGIS